jgi:fucose permease
MMVLMVGTILPYLIQEAKINFSVAGGFLSAFAIGNLLASFINPPVIAIMGRKITIIAMTALIPISLLVIMAVPTIPFIYVAFVFLGIGRGSVSIFNNTVVNEIFPGKSSMLNLLHMTFAVGAFLAPFLSSFYLALGFTWRYLGYTIVGFFVITLILLLWIPAEYGKATLIEKEVSTKSLKNSQSYIKNPDFYIIGLILFFYLGLENCVNGWFVTYFKEANIMSDTLATNLVSYTWIAVMVGRLVVAYLSTKVAKKKLILYNSILTTAFFFLLIATSNVVIISISIVGLGFFFAGIYPTCVANAGIIIRGSASGMSMLLAIAALGGIIAPQIVGFVADAIGLNGAIGVLTISTLSMVAFSIVNYRRSGIS